MTKSLMIALCALGLASSAFAQNGNPCPGEKEYQVNIIGVPKGKNPDMTGNNGHRIFVNLDKKSSIYMTGDTDQDSGNGLQCGTSFTVLDANGTDNDGATLLVPCTNVNSESTSPGACYDVSITALGTPGGHVDVDVLCEFADGTIADIDAGTCDTGTIDFFLDRGHGKPVQKDITNYLRATGCFDTDASGDCTNADVNFNNVWIFNLESLLDYYWDYDNDGLRVSQVRFCEGTDCGSITQPQ